MFRRLTIACSLSLTLSCAALAQTSNGNPADAVLEGARPASAAATAPLATDGAASGGADAGTDRPKPAASNQSRSRTAKC